MKIKKDWLRKNFMRGVATGALGLSGFGLFGMAQAQAQPQALQNAPTGICMTVPGMEDLSRQACAQPWGSGPVNQGQNGGGILRGGQNTQGGPNGHRTPDGRSLYPGYWVNNPPPL